MIQPDRFLEDLTGRHARLYTSAIQDMVVAMARGNRVALGDARNRLGEVITDTMAAAEVLGATLTLRRTARILNESSSAIFRRTWEARYWLQFAESPTSTILPRTTFEEAVQDMVDRAPVTIRDAAERTAQRISQLYGEGHVTAFAKSAEQAVTERVQILIREAIRDGTEEIGAGKLIVMSVDKIRTETEAWTESYARMAFRTNVNTAVTAGRFRQAQDPVIQAVIPCFRFDAVGDADTRDNHMAADGLIFKVSNRVWNRIAPPIGWNCRCAISYVGLPELRRMGRVNAAGDIREDRLPAAAHPDPGFRHGGRPDLFLSGQIA